MQRHFKLKTVHKETFFFSISIIVLKQSKPVGFEDGDLKFWAAMQQVISSLAAKSICGYIF